MKKLALQCIFLFLLLIIAVMGYFIAGQKSQLNNTQSQITELISEVAILQYEQSFNGNDVDTTPVSNLIPLGDLIINIQPVIVRLDITGEGFTAGGSGIIIKNNGYIITNEHVIRNAVSIKVTLDNGKHYSAIVIDANSEFDLAILKFDDSQKVFPVALFGTRSDIIVGEVVVAAGFPMGQELPGPVSFTQGIISAMRDIGGKKYIQCDAQIIPGNSGGALVIRDSGKVIGITSARISPDGEEIKGFGIAIPIDIVQSYIETVLE